MERSSVTTRANWFRDARWGVFTHFLADDDVSADDWNRQVDAFDVDALASQLAEVGAAYYFITMGQNSGHYCAPNAAYDRHVGISPSKCSERDLVSDLADALGPHGIRTMVYHPSGAPDREPVAVERLKWKKFDYGQAGERLAEFQIMWEDVIREWSLRWGDKCAGWWLDGVYFADAMYRHDEAPNFGTLAAAARAGNPQSLVAFNSGVATPAVCVSEHEDYTAGELSYELPLLDGYKWEDRSRGQTRFVDGAQYQVLCFLADWWGHGGPRMPDELAISWTKFVTSREGVVTWDVPLVDYRIPQAFIDQLKAVNRAVWR